LASREASGSARGGQVLHFAPDAEIYGDGDENPSFYKVLSGGAVLRLCDAEPAASIRCCSCGAAHRRRSRLFLSRWADRAPCDHIIDLAMARQDIADYLNLTIETVSRTLSNLERAAIIRCRRLGGSV
jgi:CRP-like cAMP-binding protein